MRSREDRGTEGGPRTDASHVRRAAAIDYISNRVFYRSFWQLIEYSDKKYTAHTGTFFCLHHLQLY